MTTASRTGGAIARAYAAYAAGPGLALSAAEARAAARTLAVLLLWGPLLVALPVAEGPGAPATAAYAGASAALAIVLLLLARANRVTRNAILVAELLAVVLVFGLALATGGDSPYAALALVPLLHAAAFQTFARLAGLAGVAGVLHFAPALAGTTDRSVLVTIAVVAPALSLAAVVGAATRRWQARALEAERLADLDPLTGIGNWRVLWRRLDEELARVRRHGGWVSVVLVDLDGFKEINDRIGHQAGDRALRAVADAMRSAVRAEDVLCRQGGDEFAVIAVETDAEEARELADRLAAAIAAARPPGDDDTPAVSASVGWATADAALDGPEELVGRADAALRAAKHVRGPVDAEA